MADIIMHMATYRIKYTAVVLLLEVLLLRGCAASGEEIGSTVRCVASRRLL
jgi:hypothetical protein